MNKYSSEVKVLVGIPCGSGFIPSIMVQSLLQLRKPCPCSIVVVDRQRIDKCRNYFVKMALEGGFDYLLMIDDDNPIPDDTLEVFLKDEKDIVFAPILSRNPDKDGINTLCAFYKEDKPVGDNKTISYYHDIKELEGDGPLYKVDAGGTGCIMIKRKVLEEMAKKYEYPFEFGDITVNGQRRTMSEDVEFCERAVNLGFKIWLDERIKPIHLGNQTIYKYGMGSNNIE